MHQMKLLKKDIYLYLITRTKWKLTRYTCFSHMQNKMSLIWNVTDRKRWV